MRTKGIPRCKHEAFAQRTFLMRGGSMPGGSFAWLCPSRIAGAAPRRLTRRFGCPYGGKGAQSPMSEEQTGRIASIVSIVSARPKHRLLLHRCIGNSGHCSGLCPVLFRTVYAALVPYRRRATGYAGH